MKKFLLSAPAFLVSASLALAISPSQNMTVILPKKPTQMQPPGGPIIPPDRNFAWNPGMMSKGGIPNRTTICATLSPSGGDDTAAIQAKLDTCPSGQVVMLNSGTFIVKNFLLLNRDITLRGSGPGVTTLIKPDGGHARLPTAISGTSGIYTPEAPGATGSATGTISGNVMTISGSSGFWNTWEQVTGTGVTAGTYIVSQTSGTPGGNGTYTVRPSQTVSSTTLSFTYIPNAQPIVIVGPSPFPGPDPATSQNLTADGKRGTYSVTIANATNFAVGKFVLLDELSGASWQAVPSGFGCSGNKINSSFTASISGTTMNVTAIGAPNYDQFVIYPGDYVFLHVTPPSAAWQTQYATIVSQTSGTTGGIGNYTITPSQTLSSTTLDSAGPCPPLVWQGDHVSYAMHWPAQYFSDDTLDSNITGPFNITPGVPPASMAWFSRIDRPTNEIKEIASISGNTITFTSPISIDYRISHTAKLTRYTVGDGVTIGNSIHITNAGVENMTMVGGGNGNIRFGNAAYSWGKNLELMQWYGIGVDVDSSFRIELRDSYLHTGAWPEPGSAGYAIGHRRGASETLIENNIILDTNKDMVFLSSGTGSVVAYNYADDAWIFTVPTWQEVGLNASHLGGGHHVLFEGNYSLNFDSDYTHGNSIYITAFRNVLTGQRLSFPTDAGNPRIVGGAYGTWWNSFVGNILGRPGQMGGWVYADSSMGCDANGNNCVGATANWATKDVWKFGYDSSRWGMTADPTSLSTLIRDGNYDFLTNSQRWHNTPGGFVIPNSMYLASKPAFFGNNPWPWVDPVTGASYTLPAKARLEASYYSVAISASPSIGGTVSGGGSFAPGSTQTVTATASPGYTFTNWTEGGSVVSTSSIYAFTISANRVLVGNFSVASNIRIGETTILSNTASGWANALSAQPATLSQNATIHSLSFYVNTAAGNLRLAIYDASGTGGLPGALIAQTGSFAAVSGWNTQNVITPVALAAGNYWLAWMCDSNSLAFPWTGAAPSGQDYGWAFSSGFPSTFAPSGGAPIANHWSLYATLS